MNVKRIAIIGAGSLAAIFVLVKIWGTDFVQSNVMPVKFWTGKIATQEVEVEQIRYKLTECHSGVKKLQGAGASSPALKGEPPPGQALGTMCASLEEDLKRTVGDLLEMKKKLQDAKK